MAGPLECPGLVGGVVLAPLPNESVEFFLATGDEDHLADEGDCRVDLLITCVHLQLTTTVVGRQDDADVLVRLAVVCVSGADDRGPSAIAGERDLLDREDVDAVGSERSDTTEVAEIHDLFFLLS